MRIPSFDDFVAATGVEGAASWADAVNRSAFSFPLPTDPETAIQFANTLLTASSTMAMMMLRDYHDWLSGELSGVKRPVTRRPNSSASNFKVIDFPSTPSEPEDAD